MQFTPWVEHDFIGAPAIAVERLALGRTARKALPGAGRGRDRREEFALSVHDEDLSGLAEREHIESWCGGQTSAGRGW